MFLSSNFIYMQQRFQVQEKYLWGREFDFLTESLLNSPQCKCNTEAMIGDLFSHFMVLDLASLQL